MKRILFLFACVVTLGIVVSTAPSLAQADIAGTYGCTGSGLDGKSYSVDLSVEKKGDNYMLTWSHQGNPTAYGFGMVSGDVLSVYFETPGGPGLSVYTIGKAALTGRYAPLGAEESWPETCTVGGQAQTV